MYATTLAGYQFIVAASKSPEFSRLNFELRDFVSPRGKVQPDVRDDAGGRLQDRRSNFGEVMESMTYVDSEGPTRVMEASRIGHYVMTRNGFTLLATELRGKTRLVANAGLTSPSLRPCPRSISAGQRQARDKPEHPRAAHHQAQKMRLSWR